MTSKLKSSLMLFIFKRFLLDRRHLVWHPSRGRPWCSALYGSITRRQPFCADTKAVGLTRDSLWNLSQSCTTMKKTQMHSAPCLHSSRSVAMLHSRLSICHYTGLFALSSPRKTKSINHFYFYFSFFFASFDCQQMFHLWKGSLVGCKCQSSHFASLI